MEQEEEVIIGAYSLCNFQEIEPILYDFYGLDKLELNTAMFFAKEHLLNNPKEEAEVDTENMIYLPESPQWNIGKFHKFCREYKIEQDSLIAKVLSFVYMFFPIETATDLDVEYWEYVTMVRPEMLKLYIAMHSGEHGFDQKCRVSFQKGGVTVDNQRPWLQMELERYLDKYLGVKDVREAEKELLVVYGGKCGPKLKKDEIRIIWGTYHLLQQSNEFKSGGEKIVSRLQSRLIADFLNCCGLGKREREREKKEEKVKVKEKEEKVKDFLDEEHIRSQLNSYLKLFNSPEDFLAVSQYKLSPNNDSGRYY